MFSTRKILSISSPLLVMMVCYWIVGTVGYPYPEDDLDLVDGEQYKRHSLRMKRMNQISCHCCSNSFNSHCCLQCMQRIGKRQNTMTLHNMSPLAELDSELNGMEYPAYTDGGDSACSCCAHQMRLQPYAEWWPCCDECKRRQKRSTKDVHSEKNENERA